MEECSPHDKHDPIFALAEMRPERRGRELVDRSGQLVGIIGPEAFEISAALIGRILAPEQFAAELIT